MSRERERERQDSRVVIRLELVTMFVWYPVDDEAFLSKREIENRERERESAHIVVDSKESDTHKTDNSRVL